MPLRGCKKSPSTAMQSLFWPLTAFLLPSVFPEYRRSSEFRYRLKIGTPRPLKSFFHSLSGGTKLPLLPFNIMKWMILLLFSLGVAVAQTPTKETAPLSSLSFTVKELSTKRAEKDRWRSTWSGSYNKDVVREKQIEVEVRNFNQHPAPEVEVVVLWVGKDHDSGEIRAYHHDIEKVDLKGRETRKFVIKSPSTKENIVHWELSKETYKTGKASSGYIVTVRYGGGIAKGWGSSQDLKKMAESEWLEAAMPQ